MGRGEAAPEEAAGLRPAAPRRPGGAPACGDVEALWEDAKAFLLEESQGRSPGLSRWLSRLRPVTLCGGTITFSVRGVRGQHWAQRRMLPLLHRALRRVTGSHVRVRIEKDRSLASALVALGLPVSPPPPPADVFLSRPENQLAHEAVLRLASGQILESPRLLVLGAEGVGKSHLLRLFRYHRSRAFPRERWATERGLEFHQRFARACRERRRPELRAHLLAHDGWILDDVQELEGKLRCQELVIEVLEQLQGRGRLALLAARQAPAGKGFLPPLCSLLAAGLRLPVTALSAASRREILRRRLVPLALPEWLLQEWSERGPRDLGRALRGAREMSRWLSRRGPRVSRAEIGARFPELLSAPRRPDPMDRILEACAEFAGASREEILAGSRRRAAALGRHLAIYLAVEVVELRKSAVKDWFGALSPSVPPYVRRKIEALRQRDARADGFLRELADELCSGQRLLFGSGRAGSGVADPS